MVVGNDTDADGNLDPTKVTVGNGPSYGSAVSTGTGEITYTPVNGYAGTDNFDYQICDELGLCATATVSVTIAAAPQQPPTKPPADEPPIVYLPGTNNQHNNITEYNGPSTCLQCHRSEANEMLNTLHMQWSGPTSKLSNDTSEELGKGNNGINTFCTYAPSLKGACYSCHVRADGNAPDAPTAEDVDCLMCHIDAYQRTFVADMNNIETLTNINSEEKTYVFGKVDDQGNYTTVPDYSKMTINVVDAARTVHLPTNSSCLRCHAKAGGGDWTKRGDMGMNSANATAQQDVHLARTSAGGAGLSCVDCHAASNHKISGQGIDLVATATYVEVEAVDIIAAHHGSEVSPHLLQVESEIGDLVPVNDQFGLRLIDLDIYQWREGKHAAFHRGKLDLLGETENLFLLGGGGQHELHRELPATRQHRRRNREHADPSDAMQFLLHLRHHRHGRNVSGGTLPEIRLRQGNQGDAGSGHGVHRDHLPA